jgi:lysophospholipase L1-like esterase
VATGGSAAQRWGYLALGDSVAFGYRPPEVTPPADYLNAANFVGYPEVLAGHVSNASCPGETTGSMINPAAPSNGCENSPDGSTGYRTEFPLHVNYSGSQLDYAVRYLRAHPSTRLVTIDIGANDVFYCQETTADHCTGTDFAATLQQISTNLTTIFSVIRGQGHYHGRLVLLSYYSTDYRDAALKAAAGQLNDALSAVTHRFRGVVADGFGAFWLASLPFGGDACAAGLLVALPAGGCNEHPSARGHQVLAAAIALAF